MSLAPVTSVGTLKGPGSTLQCFLKVSTRYWHVFHLLLAPLRSKGGVWGPV